MLRLKKSSNGSDWLGAGGSVRPQYLDTNFPKDEDGRTYHVGTKVRSYVVSLVYIYMSDRPKDHHVFLSTNGHQAGCLHVYEFLAFSNAEWRSCSPNTDGGKSFPGSLYCWVVAAFEWLSRSIPP